MLLNGLGTTLMITALAACLGVALGTGLGVMRTSKRGWIRLPARLYTDLIRGTPVLVQLFIINFIVFASVPADKWLVAVIAFGLNSAAYVAEIVRAGIQSVNPGQMDAARSLGMPGGLAMREIILPQAFRNILPALGNEFVVLLKETSVVGFIGGMDLMRMGDIIRSKTYEAYVPLLSVAAVYLVLTLGIASLLQRLERRLSWGRER
ncbi:MAG: amino acid ABC transporter permease [Opitutae bacterium]|nr:amino acid ABC transporter permease [Opitutae bacterium]